MHKELKPTSCFVFFTQIRVGALTSELQEVRSQLEDAASVHERELESLRETCADLQSRADVAHKEVDGACTSENMMQCESESTDLHQGCTLTSRSTQTCKK